MAADGKSRERLYSGFKKLLAAPSLVRRSSESLSFVGQRLSSLSMSTTPSPSTTQDGGRASISSLTAKGYDEADLSAAARAAADELLGKKRERRPSFSFATWREKHRSKKKQAPIEEEKKPMRPEDDDGSSADEPQASQPSQERTRKHRHSSREHRHSGRRSEDKSTSSSSSGHKQALPPMDTVPTPIPRTPGNQITPTGSSARRRAAAGRSSGSLASKRPSGQSSMYSFSERQHEKTRTAERASTMVVDDVATVVRPHPQQSPVACSWDSDSEDDDDKYEDSQRPRGLGGRSVSMDFVEPQQSNHLMSKIWRKLPMQARLLGRGSIDLDLEKDRVSFSRSSQSKAMRLETHTEEFSVCASPLPSNDESTFGHKNLRFNFRLTYYPSAEPHVQLESYDDILVRVCQFAKHDTRRTAIKVQEFLERSMSYIRGTTSRRGQKVSISNEEIRMWRRLARHDWESEEITIMPPPTKTRGESTASSTTEDETETDEDDVIVPDEPKLQQLVDAVNYCVGSGDSLFSCEDVEELIKLEFLVEEDGWI